MIKTAMETRETLKFTIITVCRNSEAFLAETIESVINQSYKNIEHIIIDGKSTDGTIDIIKQYSSDIDIWLSEADTGMYEAMNKGLQLGSGDYFLALNSDDLLANNDTIKNVARMLNNERPDYFYGNIIKFKNRKFRKVKLFPVTFKQLLLSKHGTFAPHPCFFISAKTNRELGGYDTNYKYASDYDYILRAISVSKNGGKHLNIFVTKFRLHENSITASGKINTERKKILASHGYYRQPLLKRIFAYYLLWIYYKTINISNNYSGG
jgi:glycosyltransferase involved in cell wall biosynthesis